jgi:release factor glutamine methyltransferase
LLAHDEQELTPEQEKEYRRLIEQRQNGMPVAYLMGKKEFYGLEFEVNEAVLIPRPDTEILVEMVLEHLKPQIQNFKFQRVGHSEQSLRSEESLESSLSYSSSDQQDFLEFGTFNLEFTLVDVGTGTGCIPIAALKNRPHLKAVALETSPQAMEVAKRNADQIGVTDRLELIESDLLSHLPPNLIENNPWILTANLPYIPQDWAKHPSTKFEPDIALFGGQEGVELYRQLAKQIEALKNKPEALFLECFEFQIHQIEDFLPSYHLVETRKMTGEACGVRFELKR